MQAQARQEVVRAETAAAELDAQRQEKVLNTEVRKPADAEAYRQVTIANAERDAAIARAQAEAQQTTLTGNAEAEATKATGDAEAAVIQAKGLAEAAGIKARADALAENQDAVIAQIIAERYPEIVAAGAQAMGEHRQHGRAQRRRRHGGPPGEGDDDGWRRAGHRPEPDRLDHRELRRPHAARGGRPTPASHS